VPDTHNAKEAHVSDPGTPQTQLREELARLIGDNVYPVEGNGRSIPAEVAGQDDAADAILAAGWLPPVCRCAPWSFGCEHCAGTTPEAIRAAKADQLEHCEASVQASSDPEDGEQCPEWREPGSPFCERHTPVPTEETPNAPTP
jgi:hypothetical protein